MKGGGRLEFQLKSSSGPPSGHALAFGHIFTCFQPSSIDKACMERDAQVRRVSAG